MCSVELRRLLRRSRSGITLRPVWPWSFLRRREIKRFGLGPDGQCEHLFRPLEAEDPELADAMRRRFSTRWLEVSGFPSSRFADAMGTVVIRCGPGETPGGQCLRITSTFTGSTKWLHHWTGSRDEALTFADETAAEEGYWVQDERRYNGPTEWDEDKVPGKQTP
jgi:hypothetical protein